MTSVARPKVACRPCRTRKMKCDGSHPRCGTCDAHKMECEYDRGLPRRRSRVPGSRRSEQERRQALRNQQEPVEQVQLPSPGSVWPDYPTSAFSESTDKPGGFHEPLSLDGNESHHSKPERRDDVPSLDYEAYANATLTANAALERQREIIHRQTILDRGSIEGVPAELALHLLDIHWSRHHFFLVTYRPAFYRDMMNGGAYYSPLLLFAMLAVSSRYSERPEVGGGDHSVQSGKYFYARAKELLIQDMDKTSIPTATALLLMGNALVSAGQVDRGWLYTGMSIRMIFNLGLHIDRGIQATTDCKALEEIEIRRRLFWGAFISEKLQSLYLGRPFFIHEIDTQVPKQFFDAYEEDEAWVPVPDHSMRAIPTKSITNFVHQCRLAEICGDIMTSIYAVKAKHRPKKTLISLRDELRQALAKWMHDLPQPLKFTPWDVSSTPKIVPIHTIVLLTIYYSLVILLERPFVADGHLSSDDDDIGSWRECTAAAERIAYLLDAYRRNYTFRRIPYQLCFTTYVASTILVRNANISASAMHLAICLKAFEEMKLAHPGSSRMEGIIRSLMSRLDVTLETSPHLSDLDSSIPEIQQRTFDIDLIRQSFAPENEASRPAFHANVLDMQPEPPLLLDDVDLGHLDWDFSQATMGDDLLFGVLGNWN